MSRIKFGTGGWREIIGDQFTKENIQKLSRALAIKMKHEDVAEKGIVIGYDRRFLAKEAAKWVCEVFAGEKIPVYFISRSSPTPLIMFYVMKHEFSYGMMITASHNPAIYNGIKVFTSGGRDADELHTRDIEHYIEGLDDKPMLEVMDYEQAVKERKVIEFNPMNEYLDNIIQHIDIQEIRKKELRIALDPMYGVSNGALRTLLSTARCDVDVINEEHDTLFGGRMPSPTASSLRNLQTYVIDKGCDIGIATDGDADRIGVIDDKGTYLHANDILVLLYYYLVKIKGYQGAVVRNVATTHMLDKMAAGFSERCYEVPVGFKHISSKMYETNALIGGESSGGLTVRGHIYGKDGIYAAMLLVEMMALTGKRLSEIIEDIKEEYGGLYMEERDYAFSQKRKEQIFNTLMIEKDLPEIPYEIKKISYLDGCKIYFENGGWIIARFSGTEPLLRIFCEMEDKKDAEGMCGIMERFLELKYEK